MGEKVIVRKTGRTELRPEHQAQFLSW